MNFKSIKNLSIIKPTGGPSSQDFLSQSIVKSVHNPSNSSIFTKKQNNNALPQIQTDLLASFNPQAFEKRQQNTFRGREISERTNFISPRFQSQGKMKVSFSYGNNFNQNFQRFTLNPQTNFQSIQRCHELTPTNIKVVNRSESLKAMRPHSSLESTKDYSNLSEMSKLKKLLPPPTIISYPLSNFQTKENELKKVHRLGQKIKPFQSIKRNTAVNQQQKMSTLKVINKQKQSNETSFEVIESPRKNISSISIDKSQYVFMSENKKQQKINLQPQTYVYSGNNLASKPVKPFGFNYIEKNVSMILPIQQEQDSSMHLPVLSEKQQSLSKSMKSYGKIDNKVYLQQKKLASLSSMSMLRKMDSKQQGMIEDEQMNKISKISKISQKNGRNKTQQSPQKQKTIISPFSKLQHYEQIEKIQRRNQQQRRLLQQRIFLLQERLKNKEQENINLHKKLQNVEIQKQIQSQYEKLEIAAKLNEVEIKKLRNEIKMFKIKQKIYQNKEKQQTQIISSLKQEVKNIKNSTMYLAQNHKNKFIAY